MLGFTSTSNWKCGIGKGLVFKFWDFGVDSLQSPFAPILSSPLKMQRQKTLLSYLKKPSPEDQSSGDNTINGREFLSKNAVPIDLKEEILGTETPPEKVPLPFNNGHKSSVFSSIKHKFSREKPRYHFLLFRIFNF